MMLEDKTVQALRDGPLHTNEIAGRIGLSIQRTYDWLREFREIGSIQITEDGKCEVKHG